MTQGQIMIKKVFIAVGLQWEGTYEQARAGEIRNLHEFMEERQHEVPHRVNPDQILGVSYNNEDGFVYTICVEVSRVDEIPEGMVSLSVPTNTYATVTKTEEESVKEAYDRVWKYMQEQGYSPNGLTEKMGRLSIVEVYPAKRTASDEGKFDICIPI